MIYLFTASGQASRAFRSHFQLKKDGNTLPFSVFSDAENEIRLTVYHGGGIAAAAAVAGVCAAYGTEGGDALIYIGACSRDSLEYAGAKEEKESGGRLFICHKITEAVSGRDFYPDILYRHSLPECSVREEEAAAVYQAGAYFFGPHQMIFLAAGGKRSAEDAGEIAQKGAGAAAELEERTEEPMRQAISFVERLAASDFFACRRPPSYADEEAWAEKLDEALCCSQAMRISVMRYIHYAALSGIDYRMIVETMFQEGKLPCKDKREGKVRFEELKRKLL